jgi:hypothetical protein
MRAYVAYIPTEVRHVANLISGFLQTRTKQRTTGNFVDLFLFFMMTTVVYQLRVRWGYNGRVYRKWLTRLVVRR